MNISNKKLRAVKVPKDMVAGTVHTTKNCGMLKVVKYLSNKSVQATFPATGTEVTIEAGQIRSGQVNDVMKPSVNGKGYVGIGEYSKVNNKKAYTTWRDMLRRCYCEISMTKNPTYKDCSVVTEWHNFQVFAKWFYEDANFEEGLHLDKDIIKQSNKVYGPETCVFVSQRLNNLVTHEKAVKGDYGVGVTLCKKGNLSVRCRDTEGKSKFLGYFDVEDVDSARKVYVNYKNSVIKKLAGQQTDERLRTGLLNWVIKTN